MPRRVRLGVLVLCALIAAETFVGGYQPAKPPPTAPEEWSHFPYRTEDEWIVSQTARAVVDLARFVASNAAAPPADIAIKDVTTNSRDPLRISIGIGTQKTLISVNSYVWDPAMYQDLARSSGITPGKGSGAEATDAVVEALLHLTAPTLEAQNETVSAALTADPRDPTRHEAAAFLLGALALREVSGTFYDPRLILSRAAAHLAIARALRATHSGPPSRAGQLAEVILQLLAGRVGPASRRIDLITGGTPSPSTMAWIRALRRRATLDWRSKPDDAASLVERLEYVHTLSRMLTDSAAAEYLQGGKPEPVPDWGWRILDFPPSVENGHRFVEMTFAQTYREAVEVMRADAASPGTFAHALSVEPHASSVDRSAGRLRVIDRGTWGAHYQRHLAHVANVGSVFYRDGYGSKETATEFEAIVDRLAGNVTLWPLVLRLRARTAAEYSVAATRAVAFVRAHPEKVSYLAWSALQHRAPPQAPSVGVPPAANWFRTLFPTGTAFETRRLTVVNNLPEDLRRLRAACDTSESLTKSRRFLGTLSDFETITVKCRPHPRRLRCRLPVEA